MSDFTKTELEALLRANKAEVDVVAATMKKDMAEWREQQNVQLANLNATMQALSSKIDGKMDSVDGKLEGMQGKIDGINTAISGIQSGLSTKLTFFGITITVVIALVGIAIGMINKNTEPTYQHKPTVTQSQPVEPSHK
ncbi:hypothetical protein ABLA30_20505 [Xenorhabdus nematophila]|uniref:hypothetical protein n=1 Tax=Xenorhabdus nematophila TaxID=628 RepID=UPI0032B7CB79